jgi:hypothetical protein
MEGLIAIGFVGAIFIGGVWSSRWMQEREEHPHPVRHWKWVTYICTHWRRLEYYVHHHRKSFHRMHGLVHASYFGMVFTHGPYNLAAGALLAIAVVGWFLHLEDH